MERLLARIVVVRARREQPQIEAPEQRLRREHANLCGRELDRQREAVEAAQSSATAPALAASSRNPAGPHGRARRTARPHRGPSARCRGGTGFGRGKRRHGIEVLAGDAQRRAAGGDHRDPRRGLQQRRDLPARAFDLLEVVEQQEDASLTQVRVQRLDERPLSLLAERERLCDRRDEQRRVVDRGELDEEDAVREGIDEVGGRLQSEPRLPGAAGPGERQEPDVATELLLNIRELSARDRSAPSSARAGW